MVNIPILGNYFRSGKQKNCLLPDKLIVQYSVDIEKSEQTNSVEDISFHPKFQGNAKYLTLTDLIQHIFRLRILTHTIL